MGRMRLTLQKSKAEYQLLMKLSNTRIFQGRSFFTSFRDDPFPFCRGLVEPAAEIGSLSKYIRTS